MRGAGETVTVAQYNVQQLRTEQVQRTGDEQAAAAARVIQHVDPDVLLVNELSNNFQQGWTGRHNAEAFLTDYLGVPQRSDLAPVDFDEWVAPPCNTGMPSGIDVFKDGLDPEPGTRAYGNDCYGFGEYPGRYAMAIYSDYPIREDAMRTFRTFRWKEMPEDKMPTDDRYRIHFTPEERERMRLSSKTHADVPIAVDDGVLHLVVAHPTPPLNDGPENLNGRRCHDEIRLLGDYVRGADYPVDDDGERGGLDPDARFVVAGDMNAEPGESYRPPDGGDPPGEKGNFHYDAARRHLVENPRIDAEHVPTSPGGRERGAPAATQFGDDYARRADYVLPSAGLDVLDCGVVRPTADDDPALREAVERASDHCLVWAEIQV